MQGGVMADKVLTAATVLFLLGTLGLYGYSVNMKPDLLGHGTAVGSYVYVEGMVRQVKKGWGGELRAEVLPEGGGPVVWLLLDEPLLGNDAVRSAALTGARVRAEGVLEEYKGVLELRLANPDDVSMLQPSSLNVLWDHASILNNTSVSFRGLAFYKHLSGDYLTFRILDPAYPGLEINCSATKFRILDERPHWENGTLVRVLGWLKYGVKPPVPHIYLSGGAKGVLVGG